MSLSRTSLLAAALAASVIAASPGIAHADPPAADAPPPAASSSASSSSHSGTPGLRTAGVVSIGVGAAFILGGALIALSGVSLKKRVDDECPGKVCPASASGDLDSLRGREGAANVFFVAGALAAVTGIGLVISGGSAPGRPSDGDSSSTPRRNALVISPAGTGVTALLTF